MVEAALQRMAAASGIELPPPHESADVPTAWEQCKVDNKPAYTRWTRDDRGNVYVRLISPEGPAMAVPPWKVEEQENKEGVGT